MARPRADAPSGQHRTKAALAKAHIQELIVSGTVPAGGHITTRAVSEALAMSETPVREAMRSLAAEGWLDLHPHLGSVVAGVQTAELTEVYALRGRLGALAIELGGPSYSRRRLAEMATNIRRSEKAVAAGQIAVYIQLNRAFHTLLSDTEETRWTLRLLTMLWGQTAAMGGGFRRVPARLAQSLDEHKAILAAIVAGDFQHAAALLIEHERRAASMLITALVLKRL
ncbi:MAG TPA: GntR family transcriptional regulator [Acetobacteraceae bacterium]|jgi:DNA-binding GntR family transcriptional regulator|nr:GntR family transcriptional regulator [Acetobacteraceae bacterium]